MINPSDIDAFDLLGRWRGSARFPMVQSEDLPPGLPASLAEWYRITSCWPEVRSAGTIIYEPHCVRMGTDQIAFMEDPTGDWVWAFDSSQSNSVYEGEPNGGLHQASGDLEEILMYATMRSIILLSSFSRLGAQVPDETLPQILSSMECVDFGEWKWPRPGYRIFAASSLLAEVGPAVDPRAPWLNRVGYSAVRIAGLSELDLAYLESFSTVSWINTGHGD